MWNSTGSGREIFDELERRELTDDPAESAFAMKGDWDGKPWDPPARQQPGVYAWGEAHLLLAYIVQFEATQDRRYLDTFVRRFQVLLDLRDDRAGRVDEVRGRIMPGWGSVRFSTQPPNQGKYTSWAVHVGMILFPAARFIHRIESDPSLSVQYAAASHAFRAAIVESLTAYEDQWHERQPVDSGEIEGYYTEPMIGAAPLPLNMMNSLGRILLELHLASPNPRYLDRVTRLARFLKNRMVLRPDGAYQWAYRPGLEPPYDATAEDFSHAALNVDFMVQCFLAGVVFTLEDMHRLVKTLLAVIYRGEGRFADFINGTGDQNRYADTIAWWGELASIDRRVATLIRARFRLRPQPAGGPGGLLAAAMLGKFGSV